MIITIYIYIESEGNTALRTAFNELAAIDKETRRYKEIREATERELEETRQRGIALEDVRKNTLNNFQNSQINNSILFM